MIRLFLIPVFVIVFYLPTSWAPFTAAMVFWVAGFTDWLDGVAARKLGQTSRFGAFLDPVADKVMVATALLLIAEHYNTIWITIPAIIMISREIIISALREWMAEIGKRSSVAVSWIGKVKTFSQMFALWVLIWRYDDWMIWIGYLSLYVATILTLWSMVQYLMAAKDDMLVSDE